MVTDPVRWRRRRGAVRQRVPEVLLLQHLTELLRPPVRDQELDPGPVPQPAVAVVPEQPGHPRPHLGDLAGPDERAEALPDHRVGGQAAADPQVIPGLSGLVDHPDERHVVDFVDGALRRAAADRGLELARQVGERGVADVRLADRRDLRRGVDDLLRIQAGQRAAEDHSRRVPAGLGGAQPHRLQGVPDGGHVLDLDPVQLDVLPVGDVRGAAGVPAGDVSDRAQLPVVELAAVDPDPQHEVAVVEFLRLEHRGLAAIDAGPALGVQPVPAETAAQVGRVDGVEAVLGIDVEDPLPDVEPVVVPLVLLVLVQRLAVAEGPLALAPLSSCLGPGRGRDWHRGSFRLGDARPRDPWVTAFRAQPRRPGPCPGASGDVTGGCYSRKAPGIASAPGQLSRAAIIGCRDRWRCGRAGGRRAAARRATGP